MVKLRVPERLPWARLYRDPFQSKKLTFWIPNVNPNIVSALAPVLSIFFIVVWVANEWMGIGYLIIILWLDWLDGTIARKYNRVTTTGWFVDTISDRLSELAILVPLGGFWSYLVAVNFALSVISWYTKKNLVLWLRFIALLYLVYLAIWV